MIGKSIGNYKILEKLNEGGMGAVYRAVDTVLNREVAIKVLRPELSRQATVIERFRTEALTLARLNHPNIATLHSFFEQGNELFMILEFVPGETLDKVLQRRGALSCQEAIPIFNELLDSIDHAHELGVIHRDIKPANIMLTEKGNLKVLDFGIARFHGRARITRVGNILGTLEYMSPEQARGEETDIRSDVYALGMTLYEILTGKMPFDTENDFELIQKQIKETPERPRIINPGIPEEIEAAIIKAYAKDPDERFQTAGEFRQVLDKAYSDSLSSSYEITGSFLERSVENTSQFGIAQTGILTAAFQGVGIDSPETPTVEIIRESRFYVSNINSLDENGSGEKIDLSQSQLSTSASSEAVETSPVQPSFLSRFTRRHYGAISVGAFVLLVLFAASTFIFFKGEKSQMQAGNVENQFKAENKESVEINIKAIEQKIEPAAAQISSPPSTDKSFRPVDSQQRTKTLPLSSPRSAPNTTAKTRNTNIKKKVPRTSEAIILRQAEKLLTGS